MKHKRITYRLIILLLNLSWIFPAGLSAQVYERTDHITKSFEALPETSLEIYNKYGNIHLFPGETDSVRIEISIEVKASKEQKADKLFDFINIEFSSTKYYIVSRTTFRQNQNSFWGEVTDLANALFSGSNKIQIDYHVYMPQDIELKVENKFGNIYTTNHLGDVNINLSNGDLKANDFKKLDLELNFGNASIHNITAAKIKSGYSDLDINAVSYLQYEGKSSTVDIEEIDEAILFSKRDKVNIENLHKINGTLSFSYLDIKNLFTDLDLKSGYGGIKVNNINSGCSSIFLISEYTDIEIQTIPQPAGFIDIKYSEEPVFILPDHYNSKLTTEKLTDDIYEYKMFGNVGSKPLKIKITAKSGNITIKEN